MLRCIRLAGVAAFLLFGNGSAALGQDSRLFTELYLGGGILAKEGGSWNDFWGRFHGPEIFDKQGNKIMESFG